MMEVPYGYCQCGCGEKAPIAKRTRSAEGCTKGQPKRFISGHNTRARIGENHPCWKGGKTHDANGYIKIHRPGHPNASSKGQVSEHILIAEKALGKPLPPGVVVHHANGTTNSGPLVICQDQAYHMLLHTRAKALKECGKASWRKCGFCHHYDDPVNLKIKVGKGGCTHHSKCKSVYERNREKKIKEGEAHVSA